MNRRKALSIQIVHPSTLTETQIRHMQTLYLAHHNIDASDYEARIRYDFDEIVLFTDKRSRKIVGFKGLRKSRHHFPGFLRPILAVYMGQLYVEKAYRNLKPVQKASLKIFLKQKLLRPWEKTLIWADALTYKPYLLMLHNSWEVYPHPEHKTPSQYQDFLHHLGTQHYGDRYNPETGCIRKDHHLHKSHVAPIVPRLLKNPYIRFYAEKNTAYDRGHGLLVLTVYSWKTLFSVSRKLLQHWWRQQQKRIQQHRQRVLQELVRGTTD